MPSSRCWPVGRSRQCRIVSGSSANQSTRSRAAHTPTLLTQPPRLVDELTSGASVTTRAAASGADRVRSSSARPSAAWVVAVPDGVRPRSAGTAGGAAAGDRVAAQAGGGLRTQRGLGRAVRRTAPTGRRRRSRAARASSRELHRRQQRRVVLGVPLGRQAVALDGVGEDHRGPGVVDGGEGLAQGVEVVAARGCGSRRAGSRRRGCRRARADPRRRRVERRRAGAPGAGRPCSAAGAGTRGWTSRRCGPAGRRRRGGRTAPAAGART